MRSGASRGQPFPRLRSAQCGLGPTWARLGSARLGACMAARCSGYEAILLEQSKFKEYSSSKERLTARKPDPTRLLREEQVGPGAL